MHVPQMLLEHIFIFRASARKMLVRFLRERIERMSFEVIFGREKLSSSCKELRNFLESAVLSPM